MSTAARLMIRRSALLGCNLPARLCLMYLHVLLAGKGFVATVKCSSVSIRFRIRGFPSANRGTEVHAGSAPRDPLLVAGCRGSTVYPPHTFVGHRRGIIHCITCSDSWRTRAADPSGPPWSVPPSSVSSLRHPSVLGCQQYCSLPSKSQEDSKHSRASQPTAPHLDPAALGVIRGGPRQHFGPSPPYAVSPRRDHSIWSPLTAGVGQICGSVMMFPRCLATLACVVDVHISSSLRQWSFTLVPSGIIPLQPDEQ